MWRVHSPPKRQIDAAQTIIAIIAPLDSVKDPESGPAAPASESPALLPADDPTSPGDGPEHRSAVCTAEEAIESISLTVSGLLWR